MNIKREAWVDYIKVFACILVVLGHFFQSMVKANVLPENNLYTWFNTTIYYFHVPLFFICSGYLYQKNTTVNNWSSWKQNVVKKAVILGIPYLIFSFATWILKTIFSSSVNTEIGGLGNTLFIHPTAPYWYLYILLLIFFVTPTLSNVMNAVGLTSLALLAKIASIVRVGDGALQIYAVSNFTANWVWFVLGMIIEFIGADKIKKTGLGYFLFIVFITLSFCFYQNKSNLLSFALGLLACTAVLMVAIGMIENNMLDIAAKYTMPVFLMHTLFAAPLRAVLLKMNISNAVIQVVVGIFISFIGPIVAIEILRIIKFDWIVYPRQLLKKKKLTESKE